MSRPKCPVTETVRPNGSDRIGRIGQTEKSCARSQPGLKLLQVENTNKCPSSEIDFLLKIFADGLNPFTTIGTSHLMTLLQTTESAINCQEMRIYESNNCSQPMFFNERRI